MNIGYYTSTLGTTDINMKIFSFLNSAIENNEIENGSVFYEDIAFNPMPTRFGVFNSTDIWYFTGTLLVSGFIQADSIKKVVNKFEPLYVYDGNEKNLLKLIDTISNMDVIVTSKEDFEYVNRVCGQEPFLVEEFTTDKIREILNERSKTSQAV